MRSTAPSAGLLAALMAEERPDWEDLPQAVREEIVQRVQIVTPRDLENMMLISKADRQAVLGVVGAGPAKVAAAYRQSSSTLRLISEMWRYYASRLDGYSFRDPRYSQLRNLFFSAKGPITRFFFGNRDHLTLRMESTGDPEFTVALGPKTTLVRSGKRIQSFQAHYAVDASGGTPVVYAQATIDHVVREKHRIEMRFRVNLGTDPERGPFIYPVGEAEELVWVKKKVDGVEKEVEETKRLADWEWVDLALARWLPENDEHVHVLFMYGTLSALWLLVESAANPAIDRLPDAYRETIVKNKTLVYKYLRELYRLYKHEFLTAEPQNVDYRAALAGHLYLDEVPEDEVGAMLKYMKPETFADIVEYTSQFADLRPRVPL